MLSAQTQARSRGPPRLSSWMSSRCPWCLPLPKACTLAVQLGGGMIEQHRKTVTQTKLLSAPAVKFYMTHLELRASSEAYSNPSALMIIDITVMCLKSESDLRHASSCTWLEPVLKLSQPPPKEAHQASLRGG